MTEFEKMISGKLYHPAADDSIYQARTKAKQLCFAYGKLDPTDESEKRKLMKELLGKTGGTFCIMAPFWCDYGCNIIIGDHFFANHNTVILDSASVVFGDRVMIGASCTFNTAGHPTDSVQRAEGVRFARPITVGNDVWIGSGVHVMPGVTIGDGAVIGGGSVVVHDIPDHVVAVGNPCKPVKTIPVHGSEV